MDGRLSCRGPGNPRWRPPSPEFPSASASWEKPASAWSTICASASADWRAWSTVAWPLLCPGMRMRLRARRCRNSRSWGRELAAWRERLGLASDGRRCGGTRAGAVGPSKRWPTAYYADLAQRLAAEGAWVWIIGGPGEKEIAAQIVRTRPGRHPGSHRAGPAQCASLRSLRQKPPCPTIPGSCMSRRRLEPRRWAFSAQRALGTGLRLIRSPR